MKKNLLTIILVLLGTFSFAQENNKQDWQAVVSNGQVTVYSQMAACTNAPNGIDKNVILIKVENKTNQEITINLEYSMTYGDKCYNCEGGSPEFQHTFQIPAKGSVAGECYQTGNNDLSFLHSFINVNNKVRLTDFEVRILPNTIHE